MEMKFFETIPSSRYQKDFQVISSTCCLAQDHSKDTLYVESVAFNSLTFLVSPVENLRPILKIELNLGLSLTKTQLGYLILFSAK